MEGEKDGRAPKRGVRVLMRRGLEYLRGGLNHHTKDWKGPSRKVRDQQNGVLLRCSEHGEEFHHAGT